MHTKTSPFACIGEGIEQYFDSNLKPLKEFDLKFLIIKDPGSELAQMLLMKEYNPYQYHAQALQKFMDDNSLIEIIVNGGGKIRFRAERQQIVFYNKSYAFGLASHSELKEFCEKHWPGIEIRIDIQENPREHISISGKIYTYAKVKYEADNP